jgi:hypothetical protein
VTTTTTRSTLDTVSSAAIHQNSYKRSLRPPSSAQLPATHPTSRMASLGTARFALTTSRNIVPQVSSHVMLCVHPTSTRKHLRNCALSVSHHSIRSKLSPLGTSVSRTARSTSIRIPITGAKTVKMETTRKVIQPVQFAHRTAISAQLMA